MSMTASVPGPNPEGATDSVNPYAGLPKPPMAPPSKATARIPLIMNQTQPSFSEGTTKFLESRGVDLEKLKFRTIKLSV